jgi:hypothetical protein
MRVNIVRRAKFIVYASRKYILWKAVRMSHIAASLGGTDAMALHVLWGGVQPRWRSDAFDDVSKRGWNLLLMSIFSRRYTY